MADQADLVVDPSNTTLCLNYKGDKLIERHSIVGYEEPGFTPGPSSQPQHGEAAHADIDAAR